MGLEEMELAGPEAELGVMGVALGVVELVEVQQGGGLCPLQALLPPLVQFACSRAHSMRRRGVMMAVFSFRRSTRSSRPFSSGEPMTALGASLHRTACHVSSSNTGSLFRSSISVLTARAKLSSSGYSSRRSSRPLSPIPL